jgi:two-component system, NarL family, sensor kinase
MQNKTIILLVFIVVLLTIVALLAFVAWILYFHQKRQNAHREQLIMIRSEYENELLQTELEIQETTFQYISQEIHDNVGQLISLSKLQLNTIDLTVYPALNDKIQHSIDLQTTALNDLRDLSRSLSSELIRDSGLEAAIAFQINQLKKATGYSVDFDRNGGNDPSLDEKQEILIFRIVQEAFNNILRHAQGNEILVRLRHESGSFKLLISDNGKGFDASISASGSGISNMQKRANLMKASLSIDTKQGAGTLITLVVPTKSNS